MHRLFLLFAIITSLLLPFMVDSQMITDFSNLSVNDGVQLFNDSVLIVGEQTEIILTDLMDTISEWQDLGQQAYEYTVGLWVDLIDGFGNWWKTTLIYQMWQNLFGNGFI
ncbi:MAG: hypothetical protein QXI16_06275 [Sulfolobaceae archaeon]